MTHGLRLTRSPAPGADLDELVRRLGEPVGLSGLLDDLSRRARRGFAPGLRVRQALTWDREDRRTTQWWPQGVSTAADASETGEVLGRRLVAVSWYAKPVGGARTHGTRISFLDLDARRYQHVLLLTLRWRAAAGARRRTRVVGALPPRRGDRPGLLDLPAR